MSEKDIIEIKKGNQILNSIFKSDSLHNNELSPIFEDSKKIPDLLLFLKSNENKIEEKMDIIKILHNLFIKNNSLLLLFTKKNIINTLNFYEPLIDLYLSEKIPNDNREIIENIIKLISSQITITKAPIYYLCQKLSKYFNICNNEEELLELLTENQMLKYLNLFKIFYLGESNTSIDNINKEKNLINENGNDTKKEIKNYIYLNGKGSGITLYLNKDSINPNTDFPTIEHGITFIMWIYIDMEKIVKLKELYKDIEINLVKIDFNGREIKLILKDIYTFQICFNDSNPKTIQSNSLKINDWNNIIFSIYQTDSKNLPIKLFINSMGLSSFLSLPKKFKNSTKITSIKLLENFIGKITSVMLISKGFENREANYFSNKIKFGFYKNKILFNFILTNEKNYFANCKNYKYYEKYKSNNDSALYDLHLAKQNIKNLFAIFCPFAYNKEKNQIDDIFGNFIGILGENDCANNFVNNSKNIKKIGGIENLLPIAELIYSKVSDSKINNYKFIDKSILSPNIFQEYLYLIKKIIIDHRQNLVDALDIKFFTSLSIFIEQFPSELFNDKVLEILFEIGKETIKNLDKINIERENFVNMILLNEKIIINYDVKKRMILWKILYCFLTSDDTLINIFFDIKKICILLKFFDSQRYNKYCCKKHYAIFNEEDITDDKILEPNMMKRTNELFQLIQNYINNSCEDKNSIYLFKLLSLDISPCLQERIIDIYLNYFSDEKMDLNKRTKSFEFLLKNNFIELIEYVFSISLFDIKQRILILFKVIFGNESYIQKLKNHLNNDEKLMNNFYLFISENLLPEQIYVKKEKNEIILNVKLNNDEEFIPISHYFDKKIYEKESSYILTFLLEWALYPVQNPKIEKKKSQDYFNLHIFIIDFLISFASKCPFNYIDLLIITLSSYFNDQAILNREILFLNKNLFAWLIETIFIFHNSEINLHEYKKEDIISIQKNSLLLFKDFFIHRRPHEEINKKMHYIFRYSTHLKRIYGGVDNKKIQEVTRITRLLLETIIGIPSIQMYHKAKYCFYFIIFHKNFYNITGIKRHGSNSNIQFSHQEIGRQSTSNNLITDINKFGLNTNLIFDDKEEDIKDKSIDDFNQINLNNINNSFNLNEHESEKNSNENSDSNSISNISNIIPDYIFEGLHLNNLNEKNNKEKALKIIWEDFSLYDGIIDYYSSNIWGTEKLRKKVGVELDDDRSRLYENLIKEYGENKIYKNILLKEILKCLIFNNTKQTSNNDIIKINILHMNVILLSIALVLSKGMDENIFWEGKFTQFCFFCILVSININPNEVYYNIIQDNIYNILGYACLFMKKWNKVKYYNFIEKAIIPILQKEEIKKSTLFKKKGQNIALFKLFELRQKGKNNNESDISGLTDLKENIYIPNERTKTGITHKIKNIQKDNEIISTNISKDDSNININKYKNFKVVLKCEYNEIIKNLFSEELDRIKEERKIHLSFKSYFKKQPFSGNIYNEERMRVNQIIQNLLISYENDINNYANKKFIEVKKRRIVYKKTKTKLFSWNGFWSNKYLFIEHPELLKLKIKNHYTKEMTRPLLTSILDFEYYTPTFKRFEKEKLFNKNNYNYKINLDIDDILSEESKKEKLENNNINIIINEESNEHQITKNKYGFNFLECAYKYSYNKLWDIYKNQSKKMNLYKKLISYGKQFDTKAINRHKDNINIFKCCIVKLTHHITGYIRNEQEYILFKNSPFSIQDFENDITYDNELGCCFGSIFIHNKSDKDKIYTIISYNEIKYIFIRKYFYMESALEIFTEKNKSYFFNFKSNKDLTQFKNELLEHWNYIEIKSEGKKIIGYEKARPNFKKKYIMVSKKSEEWINNNISTLEYLMWLNIYSGRSFNDLTQYPIFPWILTNYSAEKNEEISFRNLSLPIGMINLNEKSEIRRENFIESYETLKTDLKDTFPDFNYQDYLKKGEEYFESYKTKKIKKEKENQEEVAIIEINQIPYFYGSHYSNPTYVSHFLVRIFPFSFVAIEIQGEKFDEPDRIFSSIPKTFESATTLKDDVRELIPEFYVLPELFLNDNNLDLAQNKVNSENELILINDVKLPFWSNNNSMNFVLTLRRELESYNINNSINKWIDLIFGSSQRGEKAEENHNIFKAHTYDKIVKIESVTDIDTRNSLMRQYEMGVTPYQIFENETKNKIKHNTNNILNIDEGKNYIIKFINSSKLNLLKTKYYENYKYSSNALYKEENIKISYLKISKITPVDNSKIRIFTNKGHWLEIKIENEETHDNNFLKIEESSYYKFQNNSNKYACSYRITNMETPCVVYNNNQSIIKGGFWDGRLEINNFNLEKTNDITLQIQTIFNPDLSPITVIEYSIKEKLFLCGSLDGILYLYKINNYIPENKGRLYLFDDEITSISINDNLNMFCVSSKDGFINLHILPSCDLVRTIYLNKNNKNKSILFANNIFLSNYPLPCITAYINSEKSFISYTINGKLINEINEKNNSCKLKSPILYTNNNFQDILIYGTSDGFINIRKFPEMILINSIEVFPKKEINSLCISQDKKHIYAWSSENIIVVIKASDKNKNDK